MSYWPEGRKSFDGRLRAPEIGYRPVVRPEWYQRLSVCGHYIGIRTEIVESIPYCHRVLYLIAPHLYHVVVFPEPGVRLVPYPVFPGHFETSGSLVFTVFESVETVWFEPRPVAAEIVEMQDHPAPVFIGIFEMAECRGRAGKPAYAVVIGESQKGKPLGYLEFAADMYAVFFSEVGGPGYPAVG